MAASQKLSHLLQLADQGPVMRAALAEEVAELLTDWPPDYPDSMKRVCEALLAKTARDVEAPIRARLRIQLHAEPELSARVLPRDSPSRNLVGAARDGDNDGVVRTLSKSLGVDDRKARQMLDEDTGAALAVACKGAGLDRAVFSALALIAHPGRDRAHAFAVLDAYDTVSTAQAGGEMGGWRDDANAANSPGH